MMKILITAIFFMNFIFFLGCDKDMNNRRKVEETAWRNKTHDNFVKQARMFPFRASEDKKQQIIANYSKLTVGMTKEEVANLLGDPDIEETVHSKLIDNPGFMGWHWRYCVYKLANFGQNLKEDQEVEIFYDTKGRISWIVPLNIKGLVEKGSPSHHDDR